ncbi:YdcF family protein [Haloimpatiens sp. FM7315]|uniref:YdcF family protein n=1 Tax=Haloimpatiens sp. FM7315 TaxID=3298609 RepID=UPI0035A3345F
MFIKERRSFFVGFLLVVGFLETLFYLILSTGSVFLLIFLILAGILAIIVVGILLIKNGLTMKIKENSKIANKLSLFLGVYISSIIILVILTIVMSFYVNNNSNSAIMHIYRIFTGALLHILFLSLYFGFLFFVYIVYSFLYQKMIFKKSIDYIIVLGSGLIGERVPPLLQSRLDKGIEVFKSQIERGFQPKIIVSGGQGENELVSEAFAMKKYILSKGISYENIIMEDKSTTTYENLKFSKAIMEKFHKKYSCVFITNNYHVFRASIFARKVHLKAQGVGSKTAKYFLPSAIIREYIAILVLYKWIHVFVILLTMFSFITIYII